MAWIRRNWTPEAADEWTKEDWLAILLSPLGYIGIAVGIALSMLLIPAGFWILGITIAVILLMHWIIDPKLRTVSNEFEEKQRHYLEQLEKIQQWEDQ